MKLKEIKRKHFQEIYLYNIANLFNLSTQPTRENFTFTYYIHEN